MHMLSVTKFVNDIAQTQKGPISLQYLYGWNLGCIDVMNDTESILDEYDRVSCNGR